MVPPKTKNAQASEVEAEAARPETTKEAESFVVADPAFSEL